MRPTFYYYHHTDTELALVNAIPETDPPPASRSIVGTIVLVEIIDFAKKPVSQQLLVKNRFIATLSDALKDIDPEQRLILDTSDGAALTFLGDIDDALLFAMRLRDYIRRAGGAPSPDAIEATVPLVNFDVRVALNRGPVKLMRDALGHPNIVGDGVNVAQRIVAFADIGQIIASRAYVSDVRAVSEPYAKLFSYGGSRTDKHVREHKIYTVGEADRPLEELFNKRTRIPVVKSSSKSRTAAQDETDDNPGWLAQHKTLATTGGALLLIVLALALALIWKKPTKSAAEIAAASAPVLTPPVATSTPPTAEAATPPQSTPAPTTAPETPAPTPPPEPVVKPIEEKKAPRAQGTVTFSIQPWGNIYVNGKPIGASPPLKQTKLAAGNYRIEARNIETFAPYVVNIEVKAREEVAIKHKFQ